ncbi:MAG TPA: MFS transporter [Rectinemataceae bacterium]|nr:MFS transporter [Rectinemataceae bacterium]
MNDFRYGRIFLLGFGFFGVSILWGVYNAFVPIFLSERFHLSPALIGFFMTLDNIAALFIQPPVGAWSDRLRTRLGRRMPFILVGAPISALAFGLIPMQSILPLFVACTSSMILTMALWRTPVIALMPDLTPSDKRSQANGIINFMGGVGMIVALQTGGALYKLSPNFPFWLGSALVLISAALVLVFIREPSISGPRGLPAAAPAAVSAQESGIAVSERPARMLESLREVFAARERSGARIFMAIFFWFIGYAAVDAFFTLWAVKRLGISAGDGATLLSGMPLLFVLFAIPSGLLASRIGRKTTISIGLVTMAIILFSMYILPVATLLSPLTGLPLIGIPLAPGGPRMLTIAGALLMVAGFGWSCININSLPMIVDLTEAEKIGTFTGLYYLFSTLSNIAGPNLNGWIIQITNNNYNNIMLIAPFCMLIALLFMLGVRRGEATGSASAPKD